MARSLMAASLGLMSRNGLLPTPMETISCMRISGEEETHGHIMSLTQPYPQPQARAPLGQAATELMSVLPWLPRS